jgi:hypothetical protein
MRRARGPRRHHGELAAERAELQRLDEEFWQEFIARYDAHA